MIRSLLFRFFFYLGTIVICIIFIPALIMPKKIDLIGGKILGYWIKVCLYIFLSVKIKIKGIENIPKDIPFFIASLHQSLIETFFLQTIFNSPVFILKKNYSKFHSLMAFKKIGSISVIGTKLVEKSRLYEKIISITIKLKDLY